MASLRSTGSLLQLSLLAVFLLASCKGGNSDRTDADKFPGKWEIEWSTYTNYKSHTKTYFKDGTFTTVTTFKDLPKAEVEGTWEITESDKTIRETYDFRNSTMSGIHSSGEAEGVYSFEDGKLRLDFDSGGKFIYKR